MTDQFIKKRVLFWISNQISKGNNTFNVISCITDIGMNPSNKEDRIKVEEIFDWHKQMVEMILFDGIDENT